MALLSFRIAYFFYYLFEFSKCLRVFLTFYLKIVGSEYSATTGFGRDKKNPRVFEDRFSFAELTISSFFVMVEEY